MIGTRALYLAAISLAMTTTANAAEVTQTRNFNSEEAQTLKQVFSRDKLLQQLSASQEAVGKLNKLLSKGAAGPITLVFQWNQPLFEGWGKANIGLRRIADMRTCDDLLFPVINQSPNSDFFEQLRTIRGCDQ